MKILKLTEKLYSIIEFFFLALKFKLVKKYIYILL